MTRTDRLGASWGVALVLAVVAGCKQSRQTPSVDSSPSATPQPHALPATARTMTVTEARFTDDRKPINCQDIEFRLEPGESEKDAWSKDYAGTDVVRIQQSCASFGQVVLGRCAHGFGEGRMSITVHVYRDFDDHLHQCAKLGGTWSPNNTPEADRMRAEQKREENQGG